ncbi:MAG: hypothetical protein H7A23_00745 [Leptospiraceae bacterium]|nr:hypothetical protein [Leptospiraceae bacterium]MCP5493058.1 hypothetical protein [Leptospiraceae bacterium]
MNTIAKSELIIRLNEIIKSLSMEGVVILDNGQPIAKIIPVHSNSSKFIGKMKGKITIHGDIFSTRVMWNAES